MGDGDAGKTSLRARYLTNHFQPAYRATIGTDFIARTVEVEVPLPSKDNIRLQPCANPTSHDASAMNKQRTQKMRITLSIWDTAGQERFKSLGTAFYRGADAVIIAFDVTKKGALERTMSWFRDFCAMGDLDVGDCNEQHAKQQYSNRKRFCWVAVGCKGDLLSTCEHNKDWKGTGWSEARLWFDEFIPRYLPYHAKEEDPFQNMHHGSDPFAPKSIMEPVPANPEDVLSRSNARDSSRGTTEQGASAAEGRHPHAVSAPGAQAEELTRSVLGRSYRSSRSSTPYLHRSLSKEKESSKSSTYERSRYDSNTSLGATSIYYSLRGSTTYSDNPWDLSSTIDSESRTNKAPSMGSSAKDNKTVGGQSHSSGEPVEDTERSFLPLDDESESTNKCPNREEQVKHDDEQIFESSAFSAVNSIPSGDPIPFPVQENSHSMRISNSPSEYAESSALLRRGSSNFSIDRDRLDQYDSITGKHSQEQEANRRITLYSARPSSCASTVRVADGDVEEHPQTYIDNQRHVDAAELYEDENMEQGFRLFYTSAKTGTAVEDVFKHVAERVAIRWVLQEWEEEHKAIEADSGLAPPSDQERERDRMRRAIKISAGRGTGECCS